MGSRGSDTRRRSMKKRLQKVERCCWLCGLPLDNDAPPLSPMATELDEVIPCAKGGNPLDIEQVHLVHRMCNGHKHDKVLPPGSLHDWALSQMFPHQPKAGPSGHWW